MSTKPSQVLSFAAFSLAMLIVNSEVRAQCTCILDAAISWYQCCNDKPGTTLRLIPYLATDGLYTCGGVKGVAVFAQKTLGGCQLASNVVQKK